MKVIIFSTLLLLMLVIIGIATAFVYNNLNFDKTPFRKTVKAGFMEKQVKLDDGTILNFGEGPDNGPALFLIHGQTVAWEDYATVLPELSRQFHVFAIDCHGHGKSSKNQTKYTIEAMGTDLSWFIEHVIGEAAIVSGHSSGGLVAAWLAAHKPHVVRGLVLEDPPLFATEPGRIEKTIIWVDLFQSTHRYFGQREEKDFIIYYLNHSYLRNVFGSSWKIIRNYAVAYRRQHPNQKLRVFFLPPMINRFLGGLSGPYDPKFGLAFYDRSWFKGFDQAETLSRIKCPSVLIHAKANYTKDGFLLAAMSKEDASRAHSLIASNRLFEVRSGHFVHCEKPAEFVRIVQYLARSLRLFKSYEQ